MTKLDPAVVLRILSSPSPVLAETWNRRHQRIEGAICGFTVRGGEREDVDSGAAEVASALRTLAELAATRALSFSERSLREQGIRALAAALTPHLGPTVEDARAAIEGALATRASTSGAG